MFNLHNKTAIVTGASRGIGKSIAKTLANEGCNLILISLSFLGIIFFGNELLGLPFSIYYTFNPLIYW